MHKYPKFVYHKHEKVDGQPKKVWLAVESEYKALVKDVWAHTPEEAGGVSEVVPESVIEEVEKSEEEKPKKKMKVKE